MQLGAHQLVLGSRTLVMGILNVTPDSFSDGGLFLDPAKAIDRGLELVAQGADLLDVGGESTRPGAPEVRAEDELARVLPVIAGLVRQCPGVPISIDTTKVAVAQGALEAGAVLVNDVSGLRDPAMAQLVARTGAGACVMHMRGTPKTMQQHAQYADVVAEVIAELHLTIERAGVDRAKLFIDPGIGFAKKLEHNLTLLKNLSALRALGLPIVLGTSRKSFLGTLSGVTDPAQRVAASVASVAIAAVAGAVDVARVHDVAATRQALAVADAIRSR